MGSNLVFCWLLSSSSCFARLVPKWCVGMLKSSHPKAFNGLPAMNSTAFRYCTAQIENIIFFMSSSSRASWSPIEVFILRSGESFQFFSSVFLLWSLWESSGNTSSLSHTFVERAGDSCPFQGSPCIETYLIQATSLKIFYFIYFLFEKRIKPDLKQTFYHYCYHRVY